MAPMEIQLGKRSRLHPHVVHRRYSPNQSERNPVPLNMIVLHDTEGTDIPDSVEDLVRLGELFQDKGRETSAHVGTDSDGNSGRYVSDRSKAWHCAAYNSASLGIEQIGFAKQSQATWLKNWKQLRETARWIAFWSLRYGIPIRRGAVDSEGVTRSGVIRHMDLGVRGGNHSDPGPNYPFNRVLMLARAIKAARQALGG